MSIMVIMPQLSQFCLFTKHHTIVMVRRVPDAYSPFGLIHPFNPAPSRQSGPRKKDCFTIITTEEPVHFSEYHKHFRITPCIIHNLCQVESKQKLFQKSIGKAY